MIKYTLAHTRWQQLRFVNSEQLKQPSGSFHFAAIHVFPSFILEHSLDPVWFISISFINRCINSTEIVSRRACMFIFTVFGFQHMALCRSTKRIIILKLKLSVSLRFCFNDENRDTHRCSYCLIIEHVYSFKLFFFLFVAFYNSSIAAITVIFKRQADSLKFECAMCDVWCRIRFIHHIAHWNIQHLSLWR